MKYLVSALLVVVLAAVFVLSGFRSDRIEVANKGVEVIEVNVDGDGSKMLLGENGTGYFDLDSKVQVMFAAITVDRRIEVQNTGSELLPLRYQDSNGSEQTMLIGQGGTGYVSRSTPVQIGNVDIRVARAH